MGNLLKIIGKIPNKVLTPVGMAVGAIGTVTATTSQGGGGSLSSGCIEEFFAVIVGTFIAALGIGGAGQKKADRGS